MINKRDTLSKCDTYSNHFDPKIYPFTTPQIKSSHVSKSFTKDVLEICEDKLKKDALAHLDSAASRVPTGLYVVVCKIGKYTFLALFIPPYFLLYTAPKWLLTVAIPEAFEAVSRPFIKLAKMVQKAIETTIHSIWQPVLHFIKRINSRLKQAAAILNALNQRMTETLKAVLTTTLLPFKKLTAFLAQLRKFNLVDKFKQFGESIKDGLANFINQRLEGLDRLKQKLMNRLKRNQEWISNKASTWFQPLKNAFQTSSQLSARAVAWLEQLSKNAFDKISKGYSNIINNLVSPFKNAILKQLDHFSSYLKQKIQKIKDSFNRFVKPLKKFKDGCTKHFQNLFQKGSLKIRQAHEKITSRLPKNVRESNFFAMLSRFFKLLFQVIEVPFKALDKLTQGLGQIFTLIPIGIRKTGSPIKSSISGFFGIITKVIGAVFQVVFYVLKKSIYWSLLIILLVGYTILFVGRMFADTSANAANRLKA